MGPEYENGGLSLLEAVEALSTIAESNLENTHSLDIEQEEINFKDPEWLFSNNKERVVDAVREIFKVILRHVMEVYHDEDQMMTRTKELDGIKSLMVLVGEAAKKIDRYTTLFKQKNPGSVTQLKEYRQLQEFYRRKVSRSIDEALLGKWLLALTKRAFDREREREKVRKLGETKHLFVDLDAVKKDTEYELFFIRKEDGTRFFNPRLIRNIKLVSDFGLNVGKDVEKDPLFDIKIWEDRLGYHKAQALYKFALPTIMRHLPILMQNKESDFCLALSKAVIALVLAQSKTHLHHEEDTKGCLGYLSDFQSFLREALTDRDYQECIMTAPEQLSPVQKAALQLIDKLLEGLFLRSSAYNSICSYVKALLEEGREAHNHKNPKMNGKISEQLIGDYVCMQKLFKRHPNGPLNRALNLLEEGNYHTYDPYLLKQFVESVFHLKLNSHEVDIYRLPSPTSQEQIHKAKTIEEFLAFLRSHSNEKILLINYQNRTSWKEYARAEALEKLQDGTHFSENVTVVTLPCDTEFYKQEAPYADDHQVIHFKEHLIEQVLDFQSGFYLPKEVQKSIDRTWVEQTFQAIHKLFFSQKNVLSKDARLNFIKLFYQCLELKLMEETNAKLVFLCCKDGVDASCCAGVELYLFLKMMKNEAISAADIDHISELIYAPAILTRERIILPEPLERMVGMVKVLENLQEDPPTSKETQNLAKCISPEVFSSDVRLS